MGEDRTAGKAPSPAGLVEALRVEVQALAGTLTGLDRRLAGADPPPVRAAAAALVEVAKLAKRLDRVAEPLAPAK